MKQSTSSFASSSWFSGFFIATASTNRRGQRASPCRAALDFGEASVGAIPSMQNTRSVWYVRMVVGSRADENFTCDVHDVCACSGGRGEGSRLSRRLFPASVFPKGGWKQCMFGVTKRYRTGRHSVNGQHLVPDPPRANGCGDNHVCIPHTFLLSF